MADKNNSDSDDSDADYVPEAKDGNVSEEADSGDAESDLEQNNDEPTSKRRRKTDKPDVKKSPDKEESKIDVNALWSDFKKDTSEPTSKTTSELKKSIVPEKPLPKSNFLPTSSKGGGLGGGGGLAGILGKLGKKDKLSTLEKSRLDWNNFKKAEGIEEDIQKHNRGKDGFLEKRDFLERTDVRQFELEKEMRTIKRSNR